MATTRVTRRIGAPRAAVYRALLDPAAVQAWQVPEGMSSEVHHFDPRVGGTFRISLTYEEPGHAGKTTAHTDTHHGRFLELVPGARVVEEVEFETGDPLLRGRMTITLTLSEAEGGGTDLVALHEGLPPGVPPEQNVEGWTSSLSKLAALVEGGRER